MKKAEGVRGSHFPLREAKNRLSELVRRAARGESITITLHGEPRVRFIPVTEESRPLTVDLEWLRTMKVSDSQIPAEDLIRAERDGRD